MVPFIKKGYGFRHIPNSYSYIPLFLETHTPIPIDTYPLMGLSAADYVPVPPIRLRARKSKIFRVRVTAIGLGALTLLA